VRLEAQDWDFNRAELALANPEVLSSLFDLRHLRSSDLPPELARRRARPKSVTDARIKDNAALLAANLMHLVRAGIPVAAGTDAGNPGTLPGPSLLRELERMGEAGMTPLEVLRAVTANGARVFSPAPGFGSLAPGQLADMLLLEQDPLLDIRNASTLRAVVKGGRYLPVGSLLPQDPVAVVQRQLNAYNARDIEAFLATYAATVWVREGARPASREDHASLRKTYASLFAETPALHCEIARRTVLDNRVTDHERLSGAPDGSTATFDPGLSDFGVLEMLLHKGPQPVNEIGRRIGLTSGAITVAVDRLEACRYVSRAADPGDRRARVVRLTPGGKARAGKLFAAHRAVMDSVAQRLSGGERSELIALLKKLGNCAEDYAERQQQEK
jgi:DNA-binding MarR family transcriptional regulator